MEKRPFLRSSPGSIVFGAAVVAGLYLASLQSYLLFHSLAEIFSIVVACSVFMVAWNARRSLDNAYFLFIGITYLFVGAVDILHMLSYKGMGVFQGQDANLPTQLWIAGRYLQGASLLIAPRFAGRNLNHRAVLACYSGIVALLLGSIFWRVFPDCFVEGAGLTPFKIYSEYAVSALLLASIPFLMAGRKFFDEDVLRLLVLSAAAAIVSELSFTLYKSDVYGFFNLLGHYLKILSFFLVYRAVIGTDLVRKYDRMVRDLRRSEEEIRKAKDQLEVRVEERTAELQESEERFRSVAQTANDAIISTDSRGIIVLWNQGAVAVFGYTAEEMVGTPLSRIIPHHLRKAHADGISRSGGTGVSAVAGRTVELTGVRKGGSEFPLELSVSSWKAKGELYFTGIIRDITYRKQAEEEIRAAKERLEFRVVERTGELKDLADRLQDELRYRREAEESLAHQSTLLRSMLENIGEGVVVSDRDGRFLVFNPAAKRILHIGATDTGPDGGTEQYRFFLPDTMTPYPKDRLPLVRAIRGESVFDVEMFVRHEKSSKGAWITVTASPLKGKGGEVEGGIAIFRDITMRKRAERELAESEERFRTSVENMIDGFAIFSAVRGESGKITDFRMEYINEAGARYNLSTEEEPAGALMLGQFPAAAEAGLFHEYCKVVETGEPLAKDSFVYEKVHDGKRVRRATDSRVTKLGDGFAVTWRDVTERIMAHEELLLTNLALEKSEERFRTLVEDLPVGIFIVQGGRIVFQNTEQKRLFGPIPDGMELRKFRDIPPEDADKFAELCEAAGEGEGRTLELDLRFFPYGKSSEEVGMRWAHVRTSPIEHLGRKAVLASMVDITRAKELEHLVRVREKMSSLGHVAAGIAHEIRNPLSGINIYVSTMEHLCNRSEDLSPEEREKIQAIVLQLKSASNKIALVIQRVMDFSKPTPSRMDRVNLNDAIEEAIQLSSAALRKKDVTLSKTIVPDVPPCFADPRLIEQVLLNLINNAVQAMENTDGEKRLEIGSSAEDGQILIRVSDSGPGVPLHLREKIFDPFFTTRKEGYGIGLSFSHRVITDHGGSLSVGSSRWGGAEFRIALPLGAGKSSA